MNLSFNKKVQISLLFSTLLVFAVGFVSLYRSYQSTQAYIAGGSEVTKTMDEIAGIQKDFGILIQEWKNILIRGGSAESLEKHVAGLEEVNQRLNKEADDLAVRLSSEDKKHVADFKERLKHLVEKYNQTRNEFINAQIFEPHKADKAVRGLDREVLDPIVQISKNMAEHDKAEENKMLSNMKQSLWVSTGLSFGLFLLIFFIVGAIMKKSVGTLGQVAQELSQAGSLVKQASQSISESAQSLSMSTTEAAASIAETTASTEQVSSMIRMNSENADVAKNLSMKNEEQARKGAEQVQNLVIAMNEISQSSNRITEITNVIDDISFQTNLLALNAAVEAARAGEQGKGFAVVAEAVRALAHRSSSSAKEISDLIKDSVNKVRQGVELAEKSGMSLAEIVNSVEKVSSLNTQISAASIEQSTGVGNINKAINELDKVTQINASAAQTTASSSEELSGQADLLHSLVQQLEGVLYGAGQKDEEVQNVASFRNTKDLKKAS